MRETTPRLLAKHLTDTHAALLRLWEAWRPALAPSGWQVRYLPELSPPLWELGHLAWAEETWLGRNPLRGVATSAEATHATDLSRPAAGPALPARAPAAVRGASLLPRADALFDPDRVSPTRRWHLDLPTDRRLLAYAAAARERTLVLLEGAGRDALRLGAFEAVFRHHMAHHERWVEMSQTLSLAVGSALPATQPRAVDAALEGQYVIEGAPEVGAAPGFTIDASPVTWARYLPFIEAGGYDDEQWWSPEGWAWRRGTGLSRPRHFAPDEDTGGWKRAVFGEWQPVDPAQPALHLSAHEAKAWCRWAGRRLPTTNEWLAWHARTTQQADPATTDAAGAVPRDGARQVREWTETAADAGSATVLCGSSFAALPGLHQAARWALEAPERNDHFSGFRSCARTEPAAEQSGRVSAN